MTIKRGTPGGPAFVQVSDDELLAQFARFKKGGFLKRFGLGGDVEGGADEGVGGGNPGIGGDGPSGDFGGGSGGDLGGGSIGGDALGGSDARGDFGGGNQGEGSSGPSGDTGSTGEASAAADAAADAADAADADSDTDSDAAADAGPSLGSIGSSAGFGEFNADGTYGDDDDDARTSNVAMDAMGNIAFSDPVGMGAQYSGTIGSSPFGGTFADFAPGPMGGALNSGLNEGRAYTGDFDAITSGLDVGTIDPLSAAGWANMGMTPSGVWSDDVLAGQEDDDALASATLDDIPGLENYDLGFETPTAPSFTPPGQAIVDALFDRDIRSKNSLVHPDRRAMEAVALTEQLNNIALGKTLGINEMGVLATRAAMGYSLPGFAKRGIDPHSIYDQAIAPSQFSGINRRGRQYDKDLNRAYAWAERNPDRAAQVRAAAEGILDGTIAPATAGMLGFATPQKSKTAGITDRAFRELGHNYGNFSPRAAAAYASRFGTGFDDVDDNPAFDVPARGVMGPRSEIDIAPPDLPNAVVAGLDPPAPERGLIDRIGDIFSISAQAAPAPAREEKDQMALGPRSSVGADPTAPVSESYTPNPDKEVGPVNAQPVDNVQPSPAASIGQVARDAVQSLLGGLWGKEEDEGSMPGRTAQAVMEDAFPSAMPPSVQQEVLDEAFPSPTVNLDYEPGPISPFASTDMAAMPGAAYPSRGPAMPGLSGFVSEFGVPSGLRGDRMSLQNFETPRPTEHEVDAPPAGARVASKDGFAPTAPVPPSRPDRATTPEQRTQIAGGIPGQTWPDRGVVAQPRHAAHDKFGGKALDLVAGLIPGVGALNTIAGLAGRMGYGPGSIGSWAARNSSPGIDLSRGNEFNQGEGARVYASAFPQPEPVPDKPKPPGQDDEEEERPGTIGGLRYIPVRDPLTYGYRDEHVFFANKGGMAGCGALSRMRKGK